MPPATAEPDVRRGVVAALTAYLVWGLSPLFWKQLGDVEAIDVVAWRILFTAVTMGACIAVMGRRGELAAVRRDRTQLVGYSLIWAGLALFVADAMRAAGHRRVDAAAAARAATHRPAGSPAVRRAAE